MAGRREGLRDQARVFDLCTAWASDPTTPRPPDGWHDERSPLAAEPMRWAATLRPELMAWEQVPPVLDLWKHCAKLLEPMGYSTWAGILSAERYGVPQTRKRAILLASRVGKVHPPTPTHQAYVAGEPARHEITLEGEILPWVSMAEALGWTAGERTYLNGTHEHRAERANAAERDADDPAPTIKGGHDSGERQWVTHLHRRQTGARSRPVAEPSPTMLAEGLGRGVPPLLARAILATLTEGHDVGSDAIDLFAGPGGWDVGARELCIDPLGIELDENACATRAAAGLRTLRGDVAALSPEDRIGGE